MSAIPDGIETDRQPPLPIPVGHFVVGFGFLLLGGFTGAASGAGAVPGLAMLAHTHLLLAGWVCVTIMGAMTQFVPVWSGVGLHSKRLATVQLWLLTVGLVGFATVFVFGPTELLALPAVVMVGGFWVFVYNVGRTLARVDSFDVTEFHFAVALGWFVVLTIMGLTLAITYARPGTLAELGLVRLEFRMAHATAAVFGAVCTTVVGALYQLGEMFTQAPDSPVDAYLTRVESVALPLGVTSLFAGRLLGADVPAIVGGVLVVLALLAAGLVLGRRLLARRTEWSPVLSRYAVVAASLVAWGLLTAPVWLDRPLSYGAMLGAPAARNVLVFGVLTFVLVGSLYHVVPFLLWLDRYSDRIGLEAVPMVDDLYSDRLAAIDFWTILVGATVMVVNDAVDLPTAAMAVAGTLTTVGFVVFAANMLSVLHGHSPYPMRTLLAGGLSDRSEKSP